MAKKHRGNPVPGSVEQDHSSTEFDGPGVPLPERAPAHPVPGTEPLGNASPFRPTVNWAWAFVRALNFLRDQRRYVSFQLPSQRISRIEIRFREPVELDGQDFEDGEFNVVNSGLADEADDSWQAVIGLLPSSPGIRDDRQVQERERKPKSKAQCWYSPWLGEYGAAATDTEKAIYAWLTGAVDSQGISDELKERLGADLGLRLTYQGPTGFEGAVDPTPELVVRDALQVLLAGDDETEQVTRTTVPTIDGTVDPSSGFQLQIEIAKLSPALRQLTRKRKWADDRPMEHVEPHGRREGSQLGELKDLKAPQAEAEMIRSLKEQAVDAFSRLAGEIENSGLSDRDVYEAIRSLSEVPQSMADTFALWLSEQRTLDLSSLVDVKEAAQILQLDESLVRRYARRGELGFRLPDGRYRFLKQELAEFTPKPVGRPTQE